MKRLLSLNSLILVLLFVLTQPTFARGKGPGEAGGGGTGVTINGRTELLDIAIYRMTRPTFTYPATPGFKLPNTRALSRLNLEKLTNAELPLVRAALQRLEVWGDRHAPYFIKSLRGALTRAPIYYTNNPHTGQDTRVWIPDFLRQQIPSQSLRTLSYYTKELGIFINKNEIESLDQTNQIALLMHEAIRHLQLFYELPISDEDLQAATANLVFGTRVLPPNMMSVFQDDRALKARASQHFTAHRDRACALVRKSSRTPREQTDALCKAQTISADISYAEVTRRQRALHAALDPVIDSSFDVLKADLERLKANIEKRLPFSAEATQASQLSADLSSIAVKVNDAVYLWAQGSSEAKEQEEQFHLALQVLRDVTKDLNAFSLDIIIYKVNHGYALRTDEIEKARGTVQQALLR